MRSLIDFILKYNYWLLFTLLEVISIVLLLRFNNYQGSVYFTTAGNTTGKCVAFFGNIKSYLNLRQDNVKLYTENMKLRREIDRLQSNLDAAMLDSMDREGRRRLLTDSTFEASNILAARVVGSSLNKTTNWITLDRGTADGVRPEMGVFNSDGVVGIVYLASAHYALVIPILNPKSSISCKMKHSDYFCSLGWKGGDMAHAYLEDLPRHAKFTLGDTVVTSGFSSIFPQGITVGRVEQVSNSADGLFYRVKVALAADFSSLNYVYVVGAKETEERKQLEQQIPKEE